MANDSKFKSFRMVISFHTRLGERYATLNSLLINILKSSCERYPSKEELSLALDGMYGAPLAYVSQKTGGNLLPSLIFDFVSSKYAGENQLQNAFDLASELLFKPNLVSGTFQNDVVEIERENLIREIQSVKNDKRLYALEQCVKHTCGDDDYGKSSRGDIDICRHITAQELYSHYEYLINNCNTSVIIAGDFDVTEAEKLAFEFSQKVGKGEKIKSEILPERNETQYIKELSEITQGKLVMSFTTGIGEGALRHAETVLNGIFGGTVSSKLFNVVREKMSLCYYASSRFDKHKGMIIAQCGIDCENYEKTVEAVKEQMQAVKNGDFTEEEFDNTVAALVSNAQMVTDNLSDLVSFYLSQTTSDEILEPSDLIEKINSVKREQIAELARLIKLDTVYFLCGEKEGE